MTSPTRTPPAARMLLSEPSAGFFVQLQFASRPFPFSTSQLTAFDKSQSNGATVRNWTPVHATLVVYQRA
jgi:hypothetical protein